MSWNKTATWLLREMPPDQNYDSTKVSEGTSKKLPDTSPTAAIKIVPIPNPPAGPDHGPIKVLYGGMMRMGSLSMAHALATLNFRTHHLIEDDWDVWADLVPAAKATFPRPGENPRPFTRKDWDEIFGAYDAVTDLSGYFLPQLVEAYPDAKVILVQRDFDKWYESMESEVIIGNFPQNFITRFMITVLFNGLTGVQAGVVMNRCLTGWFRADNLAGIRANARARYEEHYAWIRKNVPPERLLEYRLGDGWEPLCDFLEVEVPPKDVSFPRVNDRAEHGARVTERMGWLLPYIRRRMMKGALILAGVLVVAVPLWQRVNV